MATSARSLIERKAPSPVQTGEGASFLWTAHGWAASLFLATATLAATELGSPALSSQVLLLAVGVALLGVPHGALDGGVGRRLLHPALGGRWLPAFLIGYLGLVAIVMVGWTLLPAATLALFLLLSIGHFGSGDARERGVAGAAEIVARGAAPILVPAFAWPAEVERLFAWVSGDLHASRALVAVADEPALALWSVCAGVTVSRAFGRGDRLAVVEMAAVSLAFLLLPPLLAFTAYFCGLHSIRALIASAPPGSGPGAITDLMRDAVPISAAAVTLVLLTYLAGMHGSSPTAGTVQAVFRWLAALTVPHLVLGMLAGIATGPSPIRGLAARILSTAGKDR